MMQPQALSDTFKSSAVLGTKIGRVAQYQSPMDLLQHWLADERKMNRWKTGAPHEQHNAAEIEPVTERCCRRREVPHHMATVVVSAAAVMLAPVRYAYHAEHAKQTATPQK